MKRVLFKLLYLTGIVRLVSWMNRRKVTILCYHGVTERSQRAENDPGLQVQRDRFANQLEHLAQNYNVISLSEYLSARERGENLPAYTVVITFDDGYRNFLTVAAAELDKFRMPATMFLITERVREGAQGLNGNWTPADDETCLSWEEVRKLLETQATEFGSHTCTHQKLSQLAAAEAQRELRESLAAVNANLATPAVPLAYPYGDYSEELAKQAKSLGYSCALTTDEGPNDPATDLFKLRRTLIGDDDDRYAFAARVSGLIALLRPAAR